tara:strand:- start:41151 stop:42851 length:1701 start_codon:yes stop_codon:yes gene_type:complete
MKNTKNKMISTSESLLRISKHRIMPLILILSACGSISLAQPAGGEYGVEANGKLESSNSDYNDPPYEWGGVYELRAGDTDLVLQPGPDASIDIALVVVANDSEEALAEAARNAEKVFSSQPRVVNPGGDLVPGDQFYQLHVEGTDEMRFSVQIPSQGFYALFTQHFADEFQTTFVQNGNKVFPASGHNYVDRFGQIVILPSAIEAFGVKTEPAMLNVLTPTFSAPARVAYNSERIAQAGSLVLGRVSSIHARQGDLVSAGQTLLEVDSHELVEAQSAYLQIKTKVQSVKPMIEIAQAEYDRANKLYSESNGISLTDVQKRKADLQRAQSDLLNAEAAMVGALNHLKHYEMSDEQIKVLNEHGSITENYIVRAPIAGRVIRRDITLGKLVSPDDEALVVIADMTKLWVHVDVPESKISEVASGSLVRLHVPAIPGKEFGGVVSYVSFEINESTRTVQIRVEVQNDEELLRPGMFVQAKIIGSTGSSSETAQLSVPESAIQRIGGKPVVFVPFPEKPDTFLKRPITIGDEIGGMVPVRYGLREGEPIVVASSFILKAQLGKSTAKHAH